MVPRDMAQVTPQVQDRVVPHGQGQVVPREMAQVTPQVQDRVVPRAMAQVAPQDQGPVAFRYRVNLTQV